MSLKVLLVHEDIRIIRVHSRDSDNIEFVSVIQFLQFFCFEST